MRHVTSPEYTDDIGVYHAQQVDGAEVQLSQEFAELLSSKDDDDMVLEKVKPLVALFGHCRERDAYIAFHTEFLGRRLLLNKSVSISKERQIMQRLQDCFDTCTIDLLDYYGGTTGSFYLGNMFDDMNAMLDEMDAQESFEEEWINASTHCTEGSVQGISTSMKLLTYGKWPRAWNWGMPHMCRPCHPQVNECFDQFSQWYQGAHIQRVSGMSLQWYSRSIHFNYGLSTVEMSLWFVGANELICTMNVPMATILLLFADAGTYDLALTVADIYQAVGYSKTYVARDLIQLSHNEDRTKNLLTHHQKNRHIRGFSDEDEISLNKCYQPAAGHHLDLVDLVGLHTLQQDDKEDIRLGKITNQRRNAIDACLVHIAKREGKLKTQEFHSMVIKELREYFPCPIGVLVSHIGRLVAGRECSCDGVLLKYNASNDEYEYNAGDW